MYIIVAVFVAVIIYVLQQDLYKKNWDKNLGVDIHFEDPYIELGDTSKIVEVINNDKFLPLPVFHLKFSTSRDLKFDENTNSTTTDMYHRNDAFSILGNQKVTRRLTFTAKKRGCYTINNINCLAKDFFLLRTFAKSFPVNAMMYVLPKKVEHENLDNLLNAMLGEFISRSSIVEDLYSFDGIKTYERTDSMKKINWKATARMDELMVNTYYKTADRKVTILLNLEPNNMVHTDYLAELAISMTSTAVSKLIEFNVPVRIISNGIDEYTNDMISVDYGSSRGHDLTIDKSLARIGKCAGSEAFNKIVINEQNAGSENSAYLIISPYYKSDLLLKIDELVNKGKNVFMLVPHYDIHPIEACRDYIHDVEVKYSEV